MAAKVRPCENLLIGDDSSLSLSFVLATADGGSRFWRAFFSFNYHTHKHGKLDGHFSDGGAKCSVSGTATTIAATPTATKKPFALLYILADLSWAAAVCRLASTKHHKLHQKHT